MRSVARSVARSSRLLQLSPRPAWTHCPPPPPPPPSLISARRPPTRATRAMSAAAAQPPRPSASILLISPTNHVLLLHRVQSSTAFASAHVFPGGNLAAEQDGPIPSPDHPARHCDSHVYRLGALRECFEECGILLATDASGRLLQVDDGAREEGRRAVHANQARFVDWVREHGGAPDTDGLIPFTRWITPPIQAKRFSTQMYLYFLPLSLDNGSIPGLDIDASGGGGGGGGVLIPQPTHDGGREHTAAQFRPVEEWLADAQANQLILYPPQFFLMYLLAKHFTPGTHDNATLQHQRDAVRDFVHSSTPPWTEKCISPLALLRSSGEETQVLSLEKPGLELAGTNREGERDYVVALKFKKEGPRSIQVMTREEAFDMARREKRAAQKGVQVAELEEKGRL